MGSLSEALKKMLHNYHHDPNWPINSHFLNRKPAIFLKKLKDFLQLHDLKIAEVTRDNKGGPLGQRQTRKGQVGLVFLLLQRIIELNGDVVMLYQ